MGAPQEGQIDGGYRFLGGDPSSEKNWEPVSAPKAGDIDSGYKFLGGDPSKQENWADANKKQSIGDQALDAGRAISSEVEHYPGYIGTAARSVEGGIVNAGNKLGIVSDEYKQSIDDANVAAIAQTLDDEKTKYRPQGIAGEVAGSVTHMLPAVAAGFVNPIAGMAAMGGQMSWDSGKGAIDEGDSLVNAQAKAVAQGALGSVLGNVVAGGGNAVLQFIPGIGKVFIPAAADTVGQVAGRVAQGSGTMAAFKPVGVAADYAIDSATDETAGKEYHPMPTAADLITGAVIAAPHAGIEYSRRNVMPDEPLADGSLTHSNGALFSSSAPAEDFIAKNNLNATVAPVTEKAVNPDSKTDKILGYVVKPIKTDGLHISTGDEAAANADDAVAAAKQEEYDAQTKQPPGIINATPTDTAAKVMAAPSVEDAIQVAKADNAPTNLNPESNSGSIDALLDALRNQPKPVTGVESAGNGSDSLGGGLAPAEQGQLGSDAVDAGGTSVGDGAVDQKASIYTPKDQSESEKTKWDKWRSVADSLENGDKIYDPMLDKEIPVKVTVNKKGQKTVLTMNEDGTPDKAIIWQGQDGKDLGSFGSSLDKSAGNPVPAEIRKPVDFKTPQEVQHENYNALVKQHDISPEHAKAMRPFADKALDPVTGFNKPEEFMTHEGEFPAIERAQEYVAKTGDSAHYIFGDIANLGGINKFHGDRMVDANKDYRGLSDVFQQELEKTGRKVVTFRVGGDELGAIVIGGDEQTIRKAMDTARAKTLEYAKAHGLDQIPYAKDKDNPAPYGTGIHFGMSEIKAGKSAKTITDEAAKGVSASKLEGGHNVNRADSGTTGVVAPIGNTGVSGSTGKEGARTEGEGGSRPPGMAESTPRVAGETGSGTPAARSSQSQITRTKDGKLAVTGADPAKVKAAISAINAKALDKTIKKGMTASQMEAAQNKVVTLHTGNPDANGSILVHALSGENKTVASPKHITALDEALNGKKPKPVVASDNLIGRIKQLGGISTEHMQSLTGESEARKTKTVGLFHEGGKGLDYLATHLEKDGFPIDTNNPNDNGGVNQLTDLIQQHLGGNTVLTYDAQNRAHDEAQAKEHRDEIIQTAKKLGIKIVGRKFDDVAKDVIAEQEAHAVKNENTFSEEEYKALDDLMAKAEDIIPLDKYDQILRDAKKEYGSKSDREYNQALVDKFTEAIHEHESNSETESATASQPAESNTGDGGQNETGTDAERPDLALTGQTNAQVNAEIKAKAKAEEEAKKEPPAKNVSSDQPDMFNTQDTLFNSNRPTPKTPAQIGAEAFANGESRNVPANYLGHGKEWLAGWDRANIDAPEKTPSYGDANKLFTKTAAEQARDILRKKLGTLNAGVDPEMMQAGLTLAGYHIEAGARSFADYTGKMIEDLGEKVRPFLRGFYENVRHYPGFEASKDMTPHDEITDKIIAPAVSENESSKNNSLRDIKDIPREELAGRKVIVDVKVQDTGETAKMTLDAKSELDDLDERESVMKRLLDCIK